MSKCHRIAIPLINTQSISVNRNETPVIDEISKYCTACSKVYTCRGGYRCRLYIIHDIVLPHPRYKHWYSNDDIIPDVNEKK